MIQKLAIHGGKPLIKEQKNVNKFDILEEKAVKQVIKSGCIAQFRGNNEVHAFENEFASYIGTKYALTTTSGTTALHTAVAAFNFPKGSEVLVPAVTFISTASVVLQEGLKPVFVDIDEYYCMDPNDARRKITENTKAIIPVHLYGHPANMEAINSIAREFNLIVIEDACQSHGALYKGKKTGNLGDVGCFSFYQTKNMTCGEGGMITFSDDKLYDSLRLIKENGSPYLSDTWYDYTALGYNYNMTEVQAAIGRVQLKKLDNNNMHRQKIAEIYDQHLKSLPLQLPKISTDIVHARHNYPVILCDHLLIKRSEFVQALRAEGVPVDIAYPCTLYQTKLFEDDSFNKDCEFAEFVTSRLFTLFTDGAITEKFAILICKAIEKVIVGMC